MERLMNIRVEQGRAERYPCELLLLFSFESPDRLEGPIQDVDLEWNGFISNLIRDGDFKGELFECRLFYTQGALPSKRVLLAGLGKRAEFDFEKWRGAASKAGQFIRNLGVKRFSFPIKKFNSFSEEDLTESFVIGLLLGIYQFHQFKTLEREKIKEIDEVILLGETEGEIQWMNEGLRKGEIISESVNLARDLVNGPGNQITPGVLAEKAYHVAKKEGMEIQVLEVDQAEALGMGAFVAVTQGSQEPGKFIILEYNKG